MRTQRRSKKHPAFADKCSEGEKRNEEYRKLTPEQREAKSAKWKELTRA